MNCGLRISDGGFGRAALRSTPVSRRAKCAEQTQFGPAPTLKPGAIAPNKPNSRPGAAPSGMKRAKQTQFVLPGEVGGASPTLQVGAVAPNKPNSARLPGERGALGKANVRNKTRPTKVGIDRTDPRYPPRNAGRKPNRGLLSWASNKANSVGNPAKQSQLTPTRGLGSERAGCTNKPNLAGRWGTRSGKCAKQSQT